MRNAASAEIDYRRAFQDAPVGQAIASSRAITACNKAFAEIFRGKPSEFTGTTFERLYPTHTHFESAGEPGAEEQLMEATRTGCCTRARRW